MASINLVKITKVEFADADLTAGVVPEVLKTVEDIKDGTLNLDFPEATVTPTYGEQTQQVIYTRKAPVMNTAKMEIALPVGANLADLTGNAFATDTLTIGGTSTAKNQYLVVTGLNTEGLVTTITCPNTFTTYSWSGAMGANQELVGWMLTFSMLQDKTAGKVVCAIKVTPAA